MARPYPSTDLVRLRRISAVEALQALATHAKRDITFHPIKAAGSERWHARFGSSEFELVLTGPKFWDTRQCKGGGGAIDLAMHLAKVDFKQAVRLLMSRRI